MCVSPEVKELKEKYYWNFLSHCSQMMMNDFNLFGQKSILSFAPSEYQADLHYSVPHHSQCGIFFLWNSIYLYVYSLGKFTILVKTAEISGCTRVLN